MSDRSIAIRPATAADLPAILELYAQPELDDGQVLPIDEAIRLHRKFSCYPDYTLYVAEWAGRIVGTFALLVMDNLGHRGAPSAVVEGVAVDPSLHGRGIGRQMMRFAMRKAREKGCYKLMLSSNLRREWAHAFYDSLGFARHGYSFRIELDGANA